MESDCPREELLADHQICVGNLYYGKSPFGCCLSREADSAFSLALLSDPRMERLLTIGKGINDLRVKVKAATEYLAGGSEADDLEAVEVARNQLARDLSRELAEARELMPMLDEIVDELREQQRQIANNHKMSVGLAKIEGLSGTGKKRRFLKDAASSKAKLAAIDNLISSLDTLQKDLTSTRRSPHTCPRCSSARVSYRLSPSDLGYTLYRCEECGNAWRITEFSLHVG